MATMTRRQMAAAIMEAVELNSDEVGYLVGRWQDEKEYEDINDYAVRLQECLPEWAKIKCMYSRPFGCSLEAGDERFTLTLYSSGRVRVQTEL